MRRTLDSLGRQTLPPLLIVAVDDGSTDQTPQILEQYRTRLPSLRVVRREDRGVRAVGPGVIEAFYAGLATVDLDEFDYLCKIDLDLELPDRYFEILVGRMEADARLGTCSGKPYYPHPTTGRPISEGTGDETSAGMTKLYRVECFRQIGGFVRQVMWDGIDNHRCRMLGWKARSWDDPEIRFTHLRPMGSSQKGILTGRMRHGFGQFFMGTEPAYMLASAVRRMARPPYVIGGAAMMWGYVKAAIDHAPRYDDVAFRGFLRRYQRAALLRGKRAATRALDDSWRDRARVEEARSRKVPIVDFGEVPAHCVSLPEALDIIAARAKSGAGGFVLTPNVDHISISRRDPEFAAAYRRCFLSLADGMPLVLLSRLLRLPLRHKVSGSDLFEPLMARCAREGLPVFFVGATPEACRAATRRLQREHPTIRITGCDPSRFDLEGNPAHAAAVLRRARDGGARLIVVCLPALKQVMLSRFEDEYRPALGIGAGSALSFYVGETSRAPFWISRCGLEWVHRLREEPRRLWRRYLLEPLWTLPVFARVVLDQLAGASRPRTCERVFGDSRAS